MGIGGGVTPSKAFRWKRLPLSRKVRHPPRKSCNRKTHKRQIYLPICALLTKTPSHSTPKIQIPSILPTSPLPLRGLTYMGTGSLGGLTPDLDTGERGEDLSIPSLLNPPAHQIPPPAPPNRKGKGKNRKIARSLRNPRKSEKK